MKKNEFFTSLALTAGLLAFLEYFFGFFFKMVYPWFIIQMLVTKMFRMDPAKGQPPKKIHKTKHTNAHDRVIMVQDAKKRLKQRVKLPDGCCI